MTENLAISIGSRTDVGLQRSHNEDALAVFDLPGAQAAFIVCDGMGGLRAGEVASGEATRVIEAVLRESFAANGIPTDPKGLLRQALIRANDAVNGLNSRTLVVPAGADSEDSTVRGAVAATAPAPADGLMGTTCVAGLILSNTLYVAHAGDSRAYLWRGGALSRLTDDHSYVAERVRAGDITEAEAKTSRFRNVITRAIGIDLQVDPDVRDVPLSPGDTILVCTDGLSTMVEDDQIADVLRTPANARANPERSASALVDQANKAGGSDNVTVLLARVAGGDPSVVAATSGSAPRTRSTPTSGKNAPRGRIVDIDAPRRAGGMSSIGLLVFGALLAIIGLASVLLFIPGAREHAAHLLLKGRDVAAESIAVVGPDYRTLTYEAPAPFGDLLARGDLLTYSKEGGLYFVRDGTGAVMSLSRTGTHLHPSVASVEALASIKSESMPATHIFMTSDPQGNVYISYTKNQAVVKLDPDGKVLQTIRGFDHPEAIAVDEVGNMYVVDFNLIKIVRVHSAAPAGGVPSSAPSAPKPATDPSAGGHSATPPARPAASSPVPTGKAAG